MRTNLENLTKAAEAEWLQLWAKGPTRLLDSSEQVVRFSFAGPLYCPSSASLAFLDCLPRSSVSRMRLRIR